MSRGSSRTLKAARSGSSESWTGPSASDAPEMRGSTALAVQQAHVAQLRVSPANLGSVAFLD